MTASPVTAGTRKKGTLTATTLPGGLPEAAETAVGITSRVGARDEPVRRAGITAAVADRLHRRTRTLTAPLRSVPAPAGPGDMGCPRPVVGREHLHLGLTPAPDTPPEALLRAWAPVFTRQDTDLFAVAPLHRRPSPTEHLTALFDEALFGPGHPLGRALIGTTATRARTRTPALIGWHRTLFTAPNTILAAAGPFEHRAWVQAARTHLVLPPQPALRRLPLLGRGRIRPAHRTADSPASTARVMVGVRGIAVDDARSHTLAVVAHLAQAMADPLGGRVRVERYSDTGTFALHAATTPGTGPGALHRVWDDLAEGRFTDNDVAAARARAQGHLRALAQFPYGRMRRLTALALDTHPRPLAEDLHTLGEVDRPRAVEVARKVLSRPRVDVMVGPHTLHRTDGRG
ncbi:hypothetical protein MRI28_25625 [Nocardiopsis dassonvillei]|uniref:M16 family metallopeptidase n=1 Tax=Nocardiopsis dassonvillei TaxID=2014 RepID=UPI00200DCF24|nr:hypothetical protein [Nocardiopsis dassonvillei]MCK9872969.1 hypothetical protein [Nocardiopsis dassonvillei]